MKKHVLMILLLLVTGCSSTPDKRIDSNYKDLTEHKEHQYSLNKVLEKSHDEMPSEFASYLDTVDLGENYGAVGRGFMEAEGSSEFRCFEASKLSAKANLVSHIQTNISKKIMLGAEGFKVSGQRLQTIIAEGFEVRNLSGIKVTKNYYRKVLKHYEGSPTPFYECWSLAVLNKWQLQDLIKREADKQLKPEVSQQFERQLNKEWNRFFQLSPDTDPTSVKYDDLQARETIRKELVQGDVEGVRQNLVNVSKAFLNLPYQLGGNISDGSLDCSNYVRTVYKVIGVNLPRTSVEQMNYSKAESVSGDYKRGDLVFFNGSLRPSDQPSHVGMIINENGEFINASGNAGKVTVDNLNDPYWQGKFLGARRILNGEKLAEISRTVAGE